MVYNGAKLNKLKMMTRWWHQYQNWWIPDDSKVNCVTLIENK